MISNAWMEQWPVWYDGEKGSLIADRRRVEPLNSNKHLVKTKRAEAGLGFPVA